MIKKSTKIVVFSSILVISLFSLALYKNIIHLPIVGSFEPHYITDFSDDQKLMGATHNVFVGKVIKKDNSKNLGIGPETQFSVEVISNIKGDLAGVVKVNQFGGYENGILYLREGGDTGVPENDLNKDSNTDKLIEVGKTYLFASRYNAEQNWHTLVSHPNARKLISADKNLSLDQLKLLVEKDEKVKKWQEAYKTEIPFESDVKSGNQLNSYSSLQAGQKTK
jgi:hypothetical protein